MGVARRQLERAFRVDVLDAHDRVTGKPVDLSQHSAAAAEGEAGLADASLSAAGEDESVFRELVVELSIGVAGAEGGDLGAYFDAEVLEIAHVND